MGFTYFRLLYVVTTNPGYVPQGSRHERKSKIASQRKKREGTADVQCDLEECANAHVEKRGDGESARDTESGGAFNRSISTEQAPGLEDFYSKDVFVCQGNGQPIRCTTCKNFKPDRAHHCREIERCVRKMDHFCPWYVY